MQTQITDGYPYPLNERARARYVEQQHHQNAIDSFPFGRDHIRIAKYVSQQLDQSQQDRNAEILERFRVDAIRHRNNNLYNHGRSMLMVTESMMPGVTANPEKIRAYLLPKTHEDNQERYKQYLNLAQVSKTIDASLLNQNRARQQEREVFAREINMAKSEIIEQPPRPLPVKKHRRKSRKSNTIKKSEKLEEQFNKIQKMLKEINVSINKNSRILKRSLQIDQRSLQIDERNLQIQERSAKLERQARSEEKYVNYMNQKTKKYKNMNSALTEMSQRIDVQDEKLKIKKQPLINYKKKVKFLINPKQTTERFMSERQRIKKSLQILKQNRRMANVLFKNS